MPRGVVRLLVVAGLLAGCASAPVFDHSWHTDFEAREQLRPVVVCSAHELKVRHVPKWKSWTPCDLR